MAIQFQTNVPQTLTFPFGDFKEYPGQDGPRYGYAANTEGGGRDRVFVSAKLHEQLQAAGVTKGSQFTIEKHQEAGENHVTWIVNSSQANSPPAAPPPSRGDNAPPAAKTPQKTSEGLQSYIDTMTHIYEQTAGIVAGVCSLLEKAYDPEAARTLAATLFIQAAQKGVFYVPPEEAIPLPTEPPPQDEFDF